MIARGEPNESWSKNQQKTASLKDGPATDRKLFFPPRRCGRIRSAGEGEITMMEFASVGHVRAALESAGYICSKTIATVVFLAQSTRKPVLVEGPAGVGKTELSTQRCVS